MSKSLDNKCFFILKKNEIVFNCLNNENQIFFIKKYNIKNQSNLFIELENFLYDNLIKIEKNLKDYIKKIYVIIDLDNNLSVNLSMKYKLGTERIGEQKINEIFNLIKYQFTKYNNDQKIIHMKINKLLIDGKQTELLFLANENFKDLILEVKFECLKIHTVNHIKRIFSNYDILVEKILVASYLSQFFENQANNIIYSAIKVINGQIKNEVSWTVKKPLKKSFFERFLNFFD